MAKRIGLFVDVSNVYYCLKQRHGTRKLSYKKLLAFVKDLGEIQVAIAYGSQLKGVADRFLAQLRRLGFRTNFKEPKTFHSDKKGIQRKADWDVGIAVDIMAMLDRLDLVVLCTGDGDMAPIIDAAQNAGVTVLVVGTNISYELKAVANQCIEIPESFLESGNEITKTDS